MRLFSCFIYRFFKIRFILIAAIVLAIGISSALAQRPKRKELIEIKIFLAKETEEYDERNPHGLIAVKRIIDARSPLRNALIALTGDVTEAEKKRKLFSAMFGIKLLSVRVKNQTAYAYFTMPEGATFSGDGSPFVFEDAVKRTAMQFPPIKKVVVCLDGILDFWSESEEPSKKCE